jgi:polyisoprenyl-phosphate glycosyltransferase
MKTVSVVVPVYNEEKTISHVLSTLVNSKRFIEVICVNDCSTDNSVKRIQQIKGVTFINVGTNQGKGNAVALGIKRAKGDLIMMLDADLAGLSEKHVDEMLKPVLESGKTVGVIAFENGHFLSVFSGQRVYYRKDLLPLLAEMKKSEYGIEVLLNAAFKDKDVKQVALKGLGHMEKFEKYDSKVAISNYLSQWFVGVLKQCVKSGISANEFKNILNEMSDFISTKAKKLKQSK